MSCLRSKDYGLLRTTGSGEKVLGPSGHTVVAPAPASTISDLNCILGSIAPPIPLIALDQEHLHQSVFNQNWRGMPH